MPHIPLEKRPTYYSKDRQRRAFVGGADYMDDYYVMLEEWKDGGLWASKRYGYTMEKAKAAARQWCGL
jgi:hypothetical protein